MFCVLPTTTVSVDGSTVMELQTVGGPIFPNPQTSAREMYGSHNDWKHGKAREVPHSPTLTGIDDRR